MAIGLRNTLGPRDHGRPMSLSAFEAARSREGYRYELIDGRVYVSPMPDPPENVLDEWVRLKLWDYARRFPEVINYVTGKGRVFVHGRQRTTCPEPDCTAYHDFPRHLPFRALQWRDLSPVLVVEVLVTGRPDKDLVRNVQLYLEVPTIKEYWVLDGHEDPDRPSLRVYRRHGRRWRIIEVPPGATYTTRLLPGLELLVDPRR